MTDIAAIEAAATRLAGRARRTPLLSSPFLDDIPRTLVSGRTTRAARTPRPSAILPSWSATSSADFSRRAEKPAAKTPAAPTFHPGDRVSHPKFGKGVVVKSDILADDEQVTVSFPGLGVKILLARLARLEKVR